MKSTEFDEKFERLLSKIIGHQKPMFDFARWEQDHQKEIQEFESQNKKQRDITLPRANIWRIIMKSRTARLTVAAGVIIAPEAVGWPTG